MPGNMGDVPATVHFVVPILQDPSANFWSQWLLSEKNSLHGNISTLQTNRTAAILDGSLVHKFTGRLVYTSKTTRVAFIEEPLAIDM